MSGARFLLLAAICAALSLCWIATVAPAASAPVDGAAGRVVAGSPTQAVTGGPDGGGETIATATLINSLPYTDSDNTCGHIHDYTAACGANNAPDLFYRYVPATNQIANFSLCGSGYDTVLYVLENGVEIACNDDSCGLQSELLVSMVAGRTYIIGVSGYSTACGPYVINPCAPCGGACCLPTGCILSTSGQCASTGGIYLGNGTTCVPDPCAATPVEAVTWGTIKSAFRDARE